MLPPPPLDRDSFSPTYTFSTTAPPSSTNTPSLATANQPLKPGRKSNPLSRSTRETQRKLNHSIIEKARRTKINKALAELKCLVPDTWGREDAAVNFNFVTDKGGDDDDTEDEDESGNGDDDGEYNPGSAAGNESGGKRQSRTGSTSAHIASAKAGEGRRGNRREKGFKLEVLERTVGYLREMVGRVRELEEEIEALREGQKSTVTRTEMETGEYADGCSRCSDKDVLNTGGVNDAKKRKRDSLLEEEVGEEEQASHHFETDSLSPLPSAQTLSNMELPTARSRLPSISSWLPSSLATGTPAAAGTSQHINPIPFTHSRSRSRSTSPRTHLYLPSPNSSTTLNSIHYHPSDGVPQKWNLGGPIVSSAPSQQGPTEDPDLAIVGTSLMTQGGMTPEDEFAASSLLGLQNGMERRFGGPVGSHWLSGLGGSSSSDDYPMSDCRQQL